jgi:hypothetical protein
LDRSKLHAEISTGRPTVPTAGKLSLDLVACLTNRLAGFGAARDAGTEHGLPRRAD